MDDLKLDIYYYLIYLLSISDNILLILEVDVRSNQVKKFRVDQFHFVS